MNKNATDEFARLVEATANSVGNWESGRKTPSAAMRTKLLAARKLGRKAARQLLEGQSKAKK